jgi:REP element-mobilizing transposase RayT
MRMGRLRRPYLPGGIFHLTARAIDLRRRFTSRLKTAAMEAVADVVPRSGVRLLAVAIMSSHLHLVVQQGKPPLSALMQPLLRRLALKLQRAHGLEGPMFWRHYGCQPCQDPRHVRNAIVYTHLNPVRAGLCRDPGAYPWTSHALYVWEQTTTLRAIAALAPILDPAPALRLFAAERGRPASRLREDYVEFVRRRLLVDAAREGDEEQDPLADPPGTTWPPWPGAWDPDWSNSLSPLFHPAQRANRPADPQLRRQLAPDMTTIARNVLAQETWTLSLGEIRGRGGGLERSRVRRAIMHRLHAAGYRNVEIARFLGLSESAVSYGLRSPSASMRTSIS